VTFSLNVSETILAKADRVFLELTTKILVWRELPIVPDERYHVILENRLGGRLYVTRGRSAYDDEGILIANVIAIKRPELLRLGGTFALEDQCVYSVATISLQSDSSSTTVSIHHRLSTETAETSLKQHEESWTKFLARLKQLAEGELEPPPKADRPKDAVDEIDELISGSRKPTNDNAWQRLKSKLDRRKPEMTKKELDKTYKEFLETLSEVRQAVADALAIERQLENEVQRRINEAQSWNEKISELSIKRDDYGAKRARDNMQVSLDIANQLSDTLNEQRRSNAFLKERLVKLEAEAQRAYSRRQSQLALKAADEAKHKVQDSDADTGAYSGAGVSGVAQQFANDVREGFQFVPESYLEQTMKLLERALTVIEQLERQLEQDGTKKDNAPKESE
jgi:hypothetical protein